MKAGAQTSKRGSPFKIEGRGSRSPTIDSPASFSRPPRLLDQMREALRSRHYSRRTEQIYCQWVKRYIHFHYVRHPAEIAEPKINAFLTHLAVREKVRASTQCQVLSALLFLYRHVLSSEVGDLGEVIRARKPKWLPVVMTREEVKAVLANLPLEERKNRRRRTASCSRIDHPEGDEQRGEKGRFGQAYHMPHLSTFVRHAAPGNWILHQDGTGTSRPQGRENHHDLHPCPQPGRQGSQVSRG